MYEHALAEVYDATYHFKDFKAESRYLADLIRSRLPSARSLLEVGCGTGLYLEQLSTQFEVQGLDLSEDMLQVAKNRLGEVPLHQGDMADFDVHRKFDVVCCLFRSIAYVKTRDRFSEAIKSMARHVDRGGLLIIEPFFTPESFWVDNITLNEHSTSDMKVAWMYVGQKVDNVALLDIHWLVGTKDGVKHFRELHEMGLFSEADYRNAFQSANFDFEFVPDSPGGTGIYVAKAPHA